MCTFTPTLCMTSACGRVTGPGHPKPLNTSRWYLFWFAGALHCDARCTALARAGQAVCPPACSVVPLPALVSQCNRRTMHLATSDPCMHDTHFGFGYQHSQYLVPVVVAQLRPEVHQLLHRGSRGCDPACTYARPPTTRTEKLQMSSSR